MIKESSARVYHTTITTALVSAVIFLAFVSIGNAQSLKFPFGVIGDTSYSKIAEQEFDRMMAALNKETLAFVVHVGDFEADPNPYERSPDKITMPCTDENFQRVLATFQKSANPFILTPGDNDWSDCIKLKARKFDPMERLAKLREMFFPEGRSLGQKTIAVDSQAKEAAFKQYRENLMWSVNGVTFATLHTVGSNNNKGVTPEMDVEHAERTKANIAWMKKASLQRERLRCVGSCSLPRRTSPSSLIGPRASSSATCGVLAAECRRMPRAQAMTRWSMRWRPRWNRSVVPCCSCTAIRTSSA